MLGMLLVHLLGVLLLSLDLHSLVLVRLLGCGLRAVSVWRLAERGADWGLAELISLCGREQGW